MVQNPAVP